MINQAGEVKENAEIASEKEIIDNASIEAMGKNKYGNLEEEEFQNALDSQTGGKAEVTDMGDNFEVFFTDSKRYYEVDGNGNVGDFSLGVTDPYPGDITKDENGNTLTGDSEDNAYQINCIEDLVAFSNLSNNSGKYFKDGQLTEISGSNSISMNGKYIILTRDLNFKSRASYIDSKRTDFGNINGDDSDGNALITEMTTGTGFTPIGYSKSLCCNFNGNNHSISNLYIKNTIDNTSAGFFGELRTVDNQEVVIRNLTIEGEVNNQGGGSMSSTGGIVASCSGENNIKIDNCTSNVKVLANGYGAGGIIGRTITARVEIINCINIGEINNVSESTGGIIGRLETSGKVLNSYNKGEIKSTGVAVGGIIGDLITAQEFQIINAYNLGAVSLNGQLGRAGIIGRIRDCTTLKISNIYNIANIIENNINWLYKAGAIIGFTDSNSVEINIEEAYYEEGNCSRGIGGVEDNLYNIIKKEKISGNEIMEKFNNYISTENLREEGWKNWTMEGEYPTLIKESE